MILVDTSAWVEFLRDTGTPACEAVDRVLGHGFATCDPVRMEVLAGARDEAHLRLLRGLLARGTALPTATGDYELAAAMYRTCRRNGGTVRKLVDCLIGAVAVRHGASVLHADSDFDVLATYAALAVHHPHHH